MNNQSGFMSEWDTERNGRTKEGVVGGSHQKVWWRCENGHSWESRVYSRAAGCGCPYCSGRLATKENNLLVTYPDVARQWHPVKNATMTPDMMTPGSKKKVWWKCEKGHEWRTPIYVRTSMKCGCPICSEGFKVSRIEMRIFTELKSLLAGDIIRGGKIDGIECDVLLRDLAIAIEFDGHYWHKGREVKDVCKNERLAREGIRVIRVRQIPLGRISDDDVLVLRSDSEWKVVDRIVRKLQSILGKDMGEYLYGGQFINDAEYDQRLLRMMLPLNGESLGVVHPRSVEIWDVVKNGNLTPYLVSPHSHISVWCKCVKGHKWKAAVFNISKGKGCPYCAGQKTSTDNSLKFLFPDISRQWNHNRNGDLTPELVTKSSGRKVWWTCEKGHDWDEIIKNRTRQQTGCPYCSGRRVLAYLAEALVTPLIDDTPKFQAEVVRTVRSDRPRYNVKEPWNIAG